MKVFLSLLFVLVGVLPCQAQLVTVQLMGVYEDATSQTTYNFSNVDFGPPAPDRNIAYCFYGRKSNATNAQINSGTTGGVTATISRQRTRTVSATNTVGLMIAAVPTGTSGTVSITMGAAYLRAGIAVYRITKLALGTVYNGGDSISNDPSGTLNIRANGLGIGCAMDSATATGTWAGLTETVDQAMSGGSVNSMHSATLVPTSKQTNLSVGVTFTANTESLGLWVGFSGVQPNPIVPTHWVTANGNASTGECESGDPCTLTRAMSIIGTVIEPGSYVSVASGVYNQPQLGPTNGGLDGYPVRFIGAGIGNTRITATTTYFNAASWSHTSAASCNGGGGGQCQFVYEATFDEATNYTVTALTQRGPLSICTVDNTPGCWTSILVDDRQPPYTTPSGRIYDLNEPVLYSPRTSISEVEAQHCTWWHDTTANKLYVHMCHEGAPADADNVYAIRFDYGSIILQNNADFIWFDKMSFEHAGSQGFNIRPTSTGIQITDSKFLGYQIYNEGTNGVFHDLLLKGLNTQGPIFATDNAGRCYSPQYGPTDNTTARSCFNDNADGDQLVVGVDGSATVYNGDYDRITMERGWNGFVANNKNTFNHIKLWGFANHASRYRGTGIIVRNSICNASQDCFYLEGNNFDNLLVENNAFFQATWIWLTTNGNPACCDDLVTGVVMRKNIFGSFLGDRRAWPQTDSDCNVWIPRGNGSTIFRLTPVSGYAGGDVQYTTLAEIQANTNDEANSKELAFGKWTDVSVFKNVTSVQDSRDFTTLAAGGAAALSTSCGQAGPDTMRTTSGAVKNPIIRH